MVEEFEKSGLTQKDFAAERQMTLSTLTRWLRHGRGNREKAKSADVQFHSLALPSMTGWAAEVQRSDGSIIRLQADISPELAGVILRACR